MVSVLVVTMPDACEDVMFLLTNAAVAALVMVSVLVVTMPDACEDVMFLTNAALVMVSVLVVN